MNLRCTAFAVLTVVILASCEQKSQPEISKDPAGESSNATEGSALANDEIKKRITEIIAEQLGLKPNGFSLDDPLTGKLGADELDVVELVMAIEEEFQIAIPDEAVVDSSAKGSLGIPESFSGRDFVRIVTKVKGAK